MEHLFKILTNKIIIFTILQILFVYLQHREKQSTPDATKSTPIINNLTTICQK